MSLNGLIAEVEEQSPGAAPLDQVATAAAVAGRLSEQADHLVGHFVDLARQSGASWAQIGVNLGVTKQAAHQRFVAGEPAMEAFTNRATIAVLTAQNEARERGAAETTTQHLVLGLIAEWSGVAGVALEAVGVTRDALADAVEASMPAPTPPPRSPAHRPFSAGLRRALELARRRGLRRGDAYVGTEHLLLGLVESGDEPTVGIIAGQATTHPAAGDLLSVLESEVDTALAAWHDAHRVTTSS